MKLITTYKLLKAKQSKNIFYIINITNREAGSCNLLNERRLIEKQTFETAAVTISKNGMIYKGLDYI